MKVIVDIEANSLTNPTEIWVVVCQDINTNEFHIFREVTRNVEEQEKLRRFLSRATLFVGHNILGYDYPVLCNLGIFSHPDIPSCTLDTLILSRLIDYPRKKHSLESYGEEFGYPKIKFTDFSKYSQEMEDYCVRDVEICHRIYSLYRKYCSKSNHAKAILLEHRFQLVCNDLHSNGFCFNINAAKTLLSSVEGQLRELDDQIQSAFKPRLKLIREVTPRETKHGTIARNSIPKILGSDLSKYSPGASFSLCEWVDFNPASPKQVVTVLNEAGWQPEEKTDGHVEAEREYSRLKRLENKGEKVDFDPICDKLLTMEKYGWKVNEANLATLPKNAPEPARLLAKRILYESRRRTLVEWLELCDSSSRIHGEFQGIGAWTHRMAHQKPNMANIPNEKDNQGRIKPLGGPMRKLWIAPKKRLLVGIDAEAIQLRGFAHYVNDPALINAIVNGKKEDKTDPHSFNKGVIGDVCKHRQAAKRYIYALFLGAGRGKLAKILECNIEEADDALRRILDQYPGFAYLKSQVFPADAKRGWFTAIDGRPIKVPGEELGTRKHLMMSGYLQSFEAIVMKTATLKGVPRLPKEAKPLLINMNHDDWVLEVENNVDLGVECAMIMAQVLKETGEEFELNCPITGSYWNDDLKDYNIGTNWKDIH